MLTGTWAGLLAVIISLQGGLVQAPWSPGRNRTTSAPGAQTTPNPADDFNGFNLELCGKTKLRKWQERQRAFDCEPVKPDRLHWSPEQQREERNEGRRQMGPASRDWVARTCPKPSPGSIREIDINELPFYAHLVIDRGHELQACAGALIDYEYIITAAQCVRGARKIDVIVGTNHVRGLQGHEISADMWCRPKELAPPQELLLDVAIVRIRTADRLLFSDSMQPACLKLDRRHHERAACFIGRKKTNASATYLQAHVVRRSCPEPLDLPHHACYQSGDGPRGRFCDLEPGTPVFCYDACREDSLEVQAYVVAIESAQAPSRPRAGPAPIYYTDLARLATLINDMIRTLMNDTTPDMIAATAARALGPLVCNRPVVP